MANKAKKTECSYDPSHDIALLRQLYGLNPQDVDGQLNTSTWEYKVRLFRRIMSIVDFDGIPKTWDVDFMKRVLFSRGYVAIIKTSEFGIIPMECTLTGYNVFYQPTTAVVANPYLNDKTRFVIGEDCALIKIQYNYMSVWPLLNRFATRFAMIESGIDVNLLNTKAAWVFDCDGSAQEQTARKIYSDITAGRPVVFTRVNNSPLNSDGKVGVTMLDVNKTYITDKLYDAYRETEYAFLTEIGINNSNVDKKERVNTLEVQANDDELRNSIKDWKDNIEAGCLSVKEMFGINLKANFPYYREESDNDVASLRTIGGDSQSIQSSGQSDA